jgi:hypothetical protein
MSNAPMIVMILDDTWLPVEFRQMMKDQAFQVKRSFGAASICHYWTSDATPVDSERRKAW